MEEGEVVGKFGIGCGGGLLTSVMTLNLCAIAPQRSLR